MPQAAVGIVAPDFVSLAGEIPGLLIRLARETVPAAQAAGEQTEAVAMPERPIALTCPECGGALRRKGNGGGLQYRCHIGHALGAAEMLPAQLEALEKALDVAQRILNERIELARNMIEDATAAGRTQGVGYWQKSQAEAERHIEAIRQMLSSIEADSDQMEAVSAEPAK
jgi:two-component system chemotaxis response regulator CheB